MTEKLIKDFWLLFATLDPIGTMLVFLGLTKGMDKSKQRAVALRAVGWASLVLAASLAVGQIILDYLEISMVALEMAGAIILFLFGLGMFFNPETQEACCTESHHDMAVFPLALPSIASPGAILAIILITDNDKYSIGEQALTGLVLLAVLALTLAGLFLARPIYRVIGKSGARILIRVMGMLICALATEFFLDAIATWLRRI